MKFWYTYRLPDGRAVAESGTCSAEALQKCSARHGVPIADLVFVRRDPYHTEPRPDYERIKRGVALGIAALKNSK